MEQLQNNDDAMINQPLKLSTSGSHKFINDLNKLPIEYRENITLMVTFAIHMAKRMNNIARLATNYRIHVKQKDKLVCIVSKSGIEWLPGTELIQEQYEPHSKLAKRINDLYNPTVVNEADLESELFDLFK